ncbi:TspO/MBR family protein [Synoicihabitans lomoniglobus]|uniref:Tryptophan-rich sensory protein n=1 Tax=Synoicihabitans lomoniglobus TaxID=2909285 RepID=A0AAF0I3X8_9BACT|nr:tryptophan-rich sensory protein [Opitutaceae bacterium LMO-M01]WED67302.1 tryptophan-rich sensory protein [Opitutaceae bacterium LMO-M01]
MSRWLALFLFLLAAFAVAGIGGVATASSVREWYPSLAKPPWNPPSWVFGPAWTLLYTLMSIAAWRVWLRREEFGSLANQLLGLHGVQLVLNALWSILFFGLRRPDLALVDIVILLTLLVVMQCRLARLDKPAARLWVPYVAWVAFALSLNLAIWWLN